MDVQPTSWSTFYPAPQLSPLTHIWPSCLCSYRNWWRRLRQWPCGWQPRTFCLAAGWCSSRFRLEWLARRRRWCRLSRPWRHGRRGWWWGCRWTKQFRQKYLPSSFTTSWEISETLQHLKTSFLASESEHRPSLGWWRPLVPAGLYTQSVSDGDSKWPVPWFFPHRALLSNKFSW